MESQNLDTDHKRLATRFCDYASATHYAILQHGDDRVISDVF
jgi:hypothetical protein